MDMNNSHIIAVLFAVVILSSGCATHETPQATSAIYRPTKDQLIATGKMMYPNFSQIPMSQVGHTFDEVVVTLGKMDMVGDVGPGPDGNMGHPFSNRDGYDYVICIGTGDKVTSVWRRKTSQQPLPHVQK